MNNYTVYTCQQLTKVSKKSVRLEISVSTLECLEILLKKFHTKTFTYTTVMILV